MTAYSPDNRFQSPQEVIQAVRRCLDHLLGWASLLHQRQPPNRCHRESTDQATTAPRIKLPKNRPAHAKKPKHDSLFRSLVAAAIPLVFFGSPCGSKHPQNGSVWYEASKEWSRPRMAVILLGRFQPALRSMSMATPARFERLVAGEPPQIAASQELPPFVSQRWQRVCGREKSLSKRASRSRSFDLQQELDSWASRGTTPAKDPLPENRLAQNTAAPPKDPMGANGTKPNLEVSPPKPVEPAPPVFEPIDTLLAETPSSCIGERHNHDRNPFSPALGNPREPSPVLASGLDGSAHPKLAAIPFSTARSAFKLRSGETLSLTRDDKVEIASVVEASASNLSIRLQGKNYRFESDNLPATLIDALLSLALPNDILVPSQA